MAVSNAQNMETLYADGAITKGWCVKFGTDREHVNKCTSSTDKAIGIAQNTTTTAEDAIEIALPGGGAKALLGGTVTKGMQLVPNTDGSLVKATGANDRVIAIAMDAGVSGDLINVMVQISQAVTTET